MNIAERIQKLRKKSGISQEVLSEKIGVSRQAVSKWESEQSMPDIDKIILISEYFGVTTDYLLKGIDTQPDFPKNKVDARIFTAVGTALNFIGLVIAIVVWINQFNPISVAIGFVFMAIGCMIFTIGQFIGENKKPALSLFCILNVWILILIPFSSVFNIIQGILGGFYWRISPIPELGNSYTLYALFWLLYFAICGTISIVITFKKQKINMKKV